MNCDAAATISFKALAFLAQEPGRLARFLNLTGVEPGAIRTLAGERQFQSAVLEHLLGDEKILLEFCALEAIDPELAVAAQQVLARTD
jgi:hypothetical protein